MYKLLVTILLIFSTHSFAVSAEKLVESLNLNPASKAQKQWERIFKKDRKMRRYGIDKLSDDEKEKLLEYLISHAADSDSPTVPGM